MKQNGMNTILTAAAMAFGVSATGCGNTTAETAQASGAAEAGEESTATTGGEGSCGAGSCG